ncbi:DUF1476 domain-containing protein [Pseudokordiimonas caeni]|uniref:DUF1476 domain-containing protein n=1 Tax=Pseudokordiimonas caeni TaxID=2997908 RepID=UPI0028110ACD|nr:DUF1476 domain-containing protein [Pseudokordiimonas caeni]
MTTFDSREKAFEDKFAHDEALLFKARARRNRLLGEWVAAELGLSGDAVKEYAGDVVASDLEEDGDGDVIRKVLADVTAKGLDISEHRIVKRLDELFDEAKRQIMAES